MAWTAPRTWVAGETLTAALMNTHVRDNFNAGFPVGSLHFLIQAATSTVTDVNGMGLEGNGSAPSRSTYSPLNTLHSGLSYPFGTGDGSTTFNLIDLRGRFLTHHGTSSGHSDVNNLGDSDGGALSSRSPVHHTGISSSSGSAVTSISTGSGSTQFSGTGNNFVASVSPTSGSTGASASGTVSASGRLSDRVPFAVGGVYWVKY